MAQDKEKKEPVSAVEKSAVARREEDILAFWRDHDIFQKTLKKPSPKGNFVFYDGPPFATGLPHYGHIIGGTMKDAIPRFRTMQGYHVPRRWGWDCHGLPIENLIEKELNLKSKKDIEELGVEIFNRAARESVLRYDKEWKRLIPRSGRFVDMDNAYLTMDWTYTDSVWWSFKTLWNKKLVYEGFKSMHICPRCGTTLSNFEVAQGYKDITDISAYVKFPLVQKPNTYLVAWTTTPWTLPGNVALAVNPEVDYISLEVETSEVDDIKPGETYIVGAGSDTLVRVFGSTLSYGPEPHEDDLSWGNINFKGKGNVIFKNIRQMKGSELLGLSYIPVFPYYQQADIKNKDRAWKVYAAEFVTTGDGTGIVHIAPAFGADDMKLAEKEGLPMIHHVGMDGLFRPEVTDFAGQSVKPKDEHQKGDIEIIKYLAHHGTLFAKEKIVHSYPHCWRCDTPLLNYATSSWFVKVTDLKEKMRQENRMVNWVPPEIGANRFDKGLESAPDWSISRARYWGAPMPVWRCEACNTFEVIGSVEELKKKITARNSYFVMRHGEADHNVSGVLSSRFDNAHHLTQEGARAVKEGAERLKDAGIDYVFVSPLVRTKETAQIVAETLGIARENVIVDERLAEVNFGDWNLKPHAMYRDKEYFPTDVGRFEKACPNGECLDDVRKRMGAFLYEIDARYEHKRILIVSHEAPLWLLSTSVALGANPKQALVLRGEEEEYINPGEARSLDFKMLPHNETYELDLHRPYIDGVTWACEACGGTVKRIPEVFDTWYDSGSMPYAQNHYPFEHAQEFEQENSPLFPADIIAEGVDQTRGWFYSLLVLGTGLFGRVPYKNVAVNGTVLAEDGQKMSKRLKNYPDISYIFDTYGADSLRYYLLSSPAVHAEDLAFSERGVDEVMKKIILRLNNVVSFYEMYRGEAEVEAGNSSEHVLDRWILSRFSETAHAVTHHLEEYWFDRAARPLSDFVEDLSTWYIRRSRDRFKSEDVSDRTSALQTTRYVLKETAKLFAPFMPFMAEDIFLRVRMAADSESVHLEAWPEQVDADKALLASMQEVRELVSLGLEARARAGIKVRQPLRSLKVQSTTLEGMYELIELVKDEVNVKAVLFDAKLETTVLLDIEIDAALKEEGQVREVVRAIQDLRKKAGLEPTDSIVLEIATTAEGKAFIERNAKEVRRSTLASAITFVEGDMPIVIDEFAFGIVIRR